MARKRRWTLLALGKRMKGARGHRHGVGVRGVFVTKARSHVGRTGIAET